MINDIDGWLVNDECPQLPLDRVDPVSKRASCLVARNKAKPQLRTGFLNIQGAVDMMSGLDYHHTNFMTIIDRLSVVDLSDEGRRLKARLLHEVVAYLNRLGQFHYFILSPFVKNHCPDVESLAPTIKKFLDFRHKHSAHRSIDKPRNETPHVQETQAMSMSSIGSKIFEPKPERSRNLLEAKDEAGRIRDIRSNWGKCYWICQLVTNGSNNVRNFSLEREHPKIMCEAYAVIKQVVCS